MRLFDHSQIDAGAISSRVHVTIDGAATLCRRPIVDGIVVVAADQLAAAIGSEQEAALCSACRLRAERRGW